MHTLSIVTSSIAQNTTNQPLAAALDAAVTASANGRYIFQQPTRLLAFTALGANLTRARINAPSLRGMFLPEIYPGIVGAVVPDMPIVNYPLGLGPIIQPNEELTVEVSRAGAAAAQMFGALWAAPKLTPAPPGPTYTVMAASTLTLVANQWVLGQLTFDQTLPAGTYDVVGLGVVCGAALGARLVYPGISNYRPGVLVEAAYGNKPYAPIWRQGNFGSFGRFFSVAQPAIEVFGITAGAQTANAFLDLVKTG